MNQRDEINARIQEPDIIVTGKELAGLEKHRYIYKPFCKKIKKILSPENPNVVVKFRATDKAITIQNIGQQISRNFLKKILGNNITVKFNKNNNPVGGKVNSDDLKLTPVANKPGWKIFK
jgi:hypothetical protein